MADEIQKLIRKLLAYLFVFLNGNPIFESIRNVLGMKDGDGRVFVPSLVIFAVSFLLGLTGFLLFLLLIRRKDKAHV